MVRGGHGIEVADWSDWPMTITPSTRPEVVMRSSQRSSVGMTRLRSRSQPRSVRASASRPSMVMKKGSDMCCPVSGQRDQHADRPVRWVRRLRASALGRKLCSSARA
jgi:hypothetical protein